MFTNLRSWLRQRDTWIVFRGTFIQAEACPVLNGNLPRVEKLQIYLRFR